MFTVTAVASGNSVAKETMRIKLIVNIANIGLVGKPPTSHSILFCGYVDINYDDHE